MPFGTGEGEDCFRSYGTAQYDCLALDGYLHAGPTVALPVPCRLVRYWVLPHYAPQLGCSPGTRSEVNTTFRLLSTSGMSKVTSE
jgi:hypothetical protein